MYTCNFVNTICEQICKQNTLYNFFNVFIIISVSISRNMYLGLPYYKAPFWNIYNIYFIECSNYLIS